MVQFLFDFEAYFEQVCRGIDLKRTNSTQLQQTKEAKFVAWYASDASEMEVGKLEAKLQEYKDKKVSIDEQILQHRAKILELNR